jgi:hypothetical protein
MAALGVEVGGDIAAVTISISLISGRAPPEIHQV